MLYCFDSVRNALNDTTCLRIIPYKPLVLFVICMYQYSYKMKWLLM